MTEQKLKELLDICFVAKRITETMTDLPDGIKPRHIHVIDAIHELGRQEDDVRVSDISKRLGVTMPSVTKLINELAAMNIVSKYETTGDKRSIFLRLTDKGAQLEKKYVTDYHAIWAENMTGFTDEQATTAINVIKTLQKAMPGEGLR